MKNILLLLTLILLQSLLFEYHEVIFMLPTSIHDWRQTDCASIALMYYENGMNFFEPKVHNVLMGGNHAAGEFPILYYFVACLYKIFGVHEIIYRIVFVSIFYCGLVSLYKIVFRFTKDLAASIFVPLFVFSSPFIMFFANSFIGDVPSFSMILIGWNFLFSYKEGQKTKDFWLCIIFFSLGILLKANAAISVFALIIMFILEFLGWVNLNNSKKLFGHLKTNILGFVFMLISVASWYLYAIYYNKKHSTSFFGTQSWPGWPIWETNDQSFLYSVRTLFLHTSHIYEYITIVILFVLYIYVITNKKNRNILSYGLLILITMGSALFVFKFFVGVADNIYYMINLMILPVFIIINSIIIFKQNNPTIFSSKIFKIGLLAFLVFNVSYAKGKLKDFYHEGKMHTHANINFYDKELRPFIDSIGIKKTDKIISFPDVCPNRTLYLMNRIGWTEFDCKIDTSMINKCIDDGAKYLIISDINLLGNEIIINYTQKLYASYKDIYVYKLNKQNKPLQKVKIKTFNNLFLTYNKEDISATIFASDSTKAEIFTIINIGNKIAIRANSNNKILSCNINGDHLITASKEWIYDWERFELIKFSGKSISLKTSSNMFFSIKNDSTNFIIANKENVKKSELFTFEIVE